MESRLTNQQKAYIKSLDSKKKRKELKKQFKIENKNGFIVFRDGICIPKIESKQKKEPVQPPILTKEILREVTEPKSKVIQTEEVSFLFNTPFFIENNDSEKTEVLTYRGEIYINENRLKKTYTEEQMMHCFNESRLTHPIIGFKHQSFASYLESLK